MGEIDILYQDKMNEELDLNKTFGQNVFDELDCVEFLMELEKILDSFISDWKAHGQPVKGFANLFFGQFIVLIADEKNKLLNDDHLVFNHLSACG